MRLGTPRSVASHLGLYCSRPMSHQGLSTETPWSHTHMCIIRHKASEDKPQTSELLTSLFMSPHFFESQEPLDNPRIKEKIHAQYGDGLELFAKINVNGGHAIPLFDWLKNKQAGTLWK